MNKTICFAFFALLLNAHGTAQTALNNATNQQSIELGNVDGLEDTAEDIKVAPKADFFELKTNSEALSSASNTSESSDNKITVGEKSTASAAQTPMERYRDLKLQQASNLHAGNPSTIRRYLKVDRSSLADSNGVQ